MIVEYICFLRKQVTGGRNGLAGKAADMRRRALSPSGHISQKTCLCITHKKASPDLGGCSFNHSRNLWNLLLYPSGYSFFVAEFTCPSYFVLLHTGHGTLLQVSRHFGAIGWKKRAHNIVGNIMCSSSRNKRSTWPEPDAGVGHVLF